MKPIFRKLGVIASLGLAFPAGCVTASAEFGVATLVMPNRPLILSPYLLSSVLAWSKDSLASSCASTVSSHCILGWHFAAYAHISEIQRD